MVGVELIGPRCDGRRAGPNLSGARRERELRGASLMGSPTQVKCETTCGTSMGQVLAWSRVCHPATHLQFMPC